MTKDEFIILINGMKENYIRECAIDNALSKYQITLQDDNDVFSKMAESLIDLNFKNDPFATEVIYEYCYPVFDDEPLEVCIDGEIIHIDSAETLWDNLKEGE